MGVARDDDRRSGRDEERRVSLIAQIETVTGLDAGVERTLDLVGVFVFAVSGALLAVRKGYDIVGVVALGLVTALGGGVLRDVILGSTPAVAFREPWYLLVPLAGAAAGFGAHRWIVQTLARPVLVFDAAGLGLFCVTGAVNSAAFDTTAAGAVLLGVISAVGGGLLRDVLANEHPMIFRVESTLYAIPATLGSLVVVVAWRNGWYSGTVGICAAIGVFAVRLTALRLGWRAPRPLGPRRDLRSS
jgi:uncharacterized membrane protein YeiH